MKMWIEDTSFYWVGVNAELGKCFRCFEFSEALAGFCEDHDLMNNVSSPLIADEETWLKVEEYRWMNGLCFPSWQLRSSTVYGMRRYYGDNPAVQPAEQMGKSPPAVTEDAMKPIFRVTKAPWAQFVFKKAVSPSLISFLLDFTFFMLI